MSKNHGNRILPKTKHLICSVVLSGLMIFTGCSYSAGEYGHPKEVVREPRLKFETKPDMEVNLKAIPGELIIKGIDGDEAAASMEVRCPDTIGECADHFRDLEFETSLRDNSITVKPSKGLGFKGNRSVKTILSLPHVNRLVVKMTAGEVNISDIDVNELYLDMKAGDVDIDVENIKTSLEVDLGAGDVTVKVPEDSVREVDVDVGIGDASIRRNGRGIYVPRSFLLGAQAHHFISNEGAVVWVDVNVGDIQVNLTE